MSAENSRSQEEAPLLLFVDGEGDLPTDSEGYSNSGDDVLRPRRGTIELCLYTLYISFFLAMIILVIPVVKLVSSSHK